MCGSRYLFALTTAAASLFHAVVVAQNDFGINPPSMKWSQIETATGRLIYPVGLDSTAFHVAAIMGYEQEHDASILGDAHTRHVPVIIQNRTTLPGGFSTPAPWRNEYTLIGPQNMFLGPVPWLDGLVAHEYRHSQQFQSAFSGWGVPFRVLMGETGWLFNTLLTQPSWFREGDAVLFETILSNGGRGRLPAFHMETRALRLAGYRYDYEKAHYTSFRDFVPNPYRMGYYMVTKARRDFGEEIWLRTLQDTYGRKGVFYPLNRSLKQLTGLTTPRLYDATMGELDSLWTATDATVGTRVGRAVYEPKDRTWTNYRYPHYLPDGRVVALCSGLDRIPTYVVLDSTGERALFKPGIYNEDHVTTVVQGSTLAWAESGFHPRWTGTDYSVIKLRDLATGKDRKLGTRSHYFSPAQSPDGRYVAVVENELNGRSNIVVLDAVTGTEVERLPAEKGGQFTHLRWTGEEHTILAVSLRKEGNGIVSVDPWTNTVRLLLPHELVALARPYLHQDRLYFSSGTGGIDNIHVLDLATGLRRMVTDERNGAFDPVISVDGARLLYSAYTADGYRVRELPLEPAKHRALPRDPLGDIGFHLSAERSEGNSMPVPDSVPQFTPRPYHALTDGLFKVYGWFPVPSPPEYGLEIYTQNIMSTLKGTVGGAYNTNEERFRSYVTLAYAGFWPILEGRWQHNGRRSSRLIVQEDELVTVRTQWLEDVLSAGVRLPFRLTQGVYRTDLSIGGGYDHYAVSLLDTNDVSIEGPETRSNGWHASVLFSRLHPKARQHVQPRWGQLLEADIRQADELGAERINLAAQVFFPGLARNHSFNVKGTFRKENVIEAYRFLDDRLMPRGISPRPEEELPFVQFNYELPIWYPEVSAGSLAFVQRVRLNAFTDLAWPSVADEQEQWATGGVELGVDLRFLRLFQVTLLTRFSASLSTDVPVDRPFEFLVTRFEFAN
ncbi:MAG: hypothetical protein JNL43_00880 [Flavobacteriales bacterium]|nr:hypothetical protein [Flavobacteriales bacterium]